MAGGIVLKPDGTPANIDSFTKYKLPTLEDLPPGWKRASQDPMIAAYMHAKRKLRVIVEVFHPRERGAQWIHVSYSHPKRTPNQDTTVLVKKLFIGENREAIAVFPPKSRYVNVHPHCLHLWSPLDPRERSWPKFERHIDGVGNAV